MQVVLWGVFIALLSNGILIAFVAGAVFSVLSILPFMRLARLKVIE